MSHSNLKTLICAGCISLIAGTSAALAAEVVARTDLKTADGMTAGVVSFVETPNGVLVSAQLKNTPVGSHGFHIHEVGRCEGNFESAGGHFAPNGHQHGFANVEGYHAGDMPNIFVGSDGTAEVEFFVDQITLGEGNTSINDSDGSAVILHADGDSYLADAGAGARIACGVISFVK